VDHSISEDEDLSRIALNYIFLKDVAERGFDLGAAKVGLVF
jgi:hypothetical protein